MLHRPSVVAAEMCLIIPVKAFRRVELRTIFYGFPREVKMHTRIGPFHTLDPLGRQKNFLPRQPVAGIHNQKTNRPVFVVNNKIFHMTDFTVGGMNMVACHLSCAAQMRIIPMLFLFHKPFCNRRG